VVQLLRTGAPLAFLAAVVAALSVVAVPTGGAATPTCFGRPATIVGTNAGEQLVGTPLTDVIVGLGGNDVVSAKGGDDFVCTGAGDDVVVGGSGRDHVSAGAGNDILIGGKGDDVLQGNSGLDLLLGEAGRDTLQGGPGLDLATYLTSPHGVFVDLADRTATGNGTDRLRGIEGAIGSKWRDVFAGDGKTNFFDGSSGNDILRGRGGIDVAFFLTSAKPVDVNLGRGTATGDGSDELASIEAVLGSTYDDILQGDRRQNQIMGGPGMDVIKGGRGGDICFGERFAGCESANYEDPPPLNSPSPPAAGLQAHIPKPPTKWGSKSSRGPSSP
jgi:Ca2+-binding RTX toxin-like protein